jgi:hypothetical protein
MFQFFMPLISSPLKEDFRHLATDEERLDRIIEFFAHAPQEDRRLWTYGLGKTIDFIKEKINCSATSFSDLVPLLGIEQSEALYVRLRQMQNHFDAMPDARARAYADYWLFLAIILEAQLGKVEIDEPHKAILDKILLLSEEMVLTDKKAH